MVTKMKTIQWTSAFRYMQKQKAACLSMCVVALLAVTNAGKITLLAVCGKEAVARGVRAGDIIKNIAPIVGGKGGGKPDSAMGGGKDIAKLDDALATVDDFVIAHCKH